MFLNRQLGDWPEQPARFFEQTMEGLADQPARFFNRQLRIGLASLRVFFFFFGFFLVFFFADS